MSDIAQRIIDAYYSEQPALREILIRHSTDVRNLALAVAERHPQLGADTVILDNGAMLHDIGIILCDAPAICCHGTHRYIMHGRLGAEILRHEQLPVYARIAERHTGTGLTKEQIAQQHLPLPERDFIPETIEEQIICYADKFYSKTKLDHTKTVDEITHSLQKFGQQSVEKFLQWHQIFQ